MTESDAAPAAPVAEDGQALPALHTFAQFFQTLEDGELHAQASDGLQRIAGDLSNHVRDYGGNSKGRMTITLDFDLKHGVFEITGGLTIKLPTPPRGKTVVWATPDNRFTPYNPRQMNMFGVREVAAPVAAPRAV